MVRYRDMKRNKQKGNKMKLSEITHSDYLHVLEICSEGQAGIEMNADKNGSMTEAEFWRAEEIISICLYEIKKIAKKNKQGKSEKE